MGGTWDVPLWLRWVAGGCVALAVALAAAVHVKADAEAAAAREAYRAQAMSEARAAAEFMGDKLSQIYGGLRTIAMLPSVRRVDRHGENLDEDARASIQQLYNNLKSNVDVSEIYIVPVDLNPDRIDAHTGAPQAPILMYDELIVGAGARARERGEELEGEYAEEAEVEIFEYRALRDQLSWLRAHRNDQAVYAGLDRPMLASPRVMTCDNTSFIRSGDNADREGVVLSVPFYGEDGALRGAISAIVRVGALGAYLPAREAALRNNAQNVVVFPEAAGDQRARLPDAGADLAFSTNVAVDDRDPRGGWYLSVWRRGAELRNSHAMRAASYFRWGAWTLIAIFLAGGMAAIWAVSGRLRDQRQRKDELEQLVRDRTEQLRLMAETQADLRERADSANEMKSQFLADMSHELRTPLNAIIGYAELILEEIERPETSETAQDLSRILSSGRHLLGLINQILDLAKVEAGRIELACRSFSPKDLAAACLETVRPAALANRVSLRLESDANIGAIQSDDFRITQCLLNLLSNAIKFSNGGAVTLSVRRAKGAGGIIEFAVSDTGIGIKTEQMERIFRPFAQASAGTARQFGGTGLGLAITRNMARLLGGDVTVASVWGKGATFTLCVAARLETPDAATVAGGKDLGLAA